MNHKRDPNSMHLRSSTATVVISAFVIGLTAAYGTPHVGHDTPAGWIAGPRAGADDRRDCESEQECYDRIAACIAGGGEWRGDERSGRCHPSTQR